MKTKLSNLGIIQSGTIRLSHDQVFNFDEKVVCIYCILPFWLGKLYSIFSHKLRFKLKIEVIFNALKGNG